MAPLNYAIRTSGCIYTNYTWNISGDASNSRKISGDAWDTRKIGGDDSPEPITYLADLFEIPNWHDS